MTVFLEHSSWRWWIVGEEAKMSWHVRYFDRTLKHEVLSSEFASKEDALEHAWQLAEGENDIEAIEGPDEELVTVEEIGSWFDQHTLREGDSDPKLGRI
jgi:hypothetical protein